MTYEEARLATGEAIEFNTKLDVSSGQNIITLEIPTSAPDDHVSVIKLVVAGTVTIERHSCNWATAR